MAEQVWERPHWHGPTAIVASEQDTNGPVTKIAMMGTKLRVNAQVIIKNFLNLQNTHAKSLPPMGARRRMELE
jgi:hypothetical protein